MPEPLLTRAAKDDRGRGCALEVLQLLCVIQSRGRGRAAHSYSLAYASRQLQIPCDHFIAKIGATNKPSIRLFEKLGFVIVKHVEVFDEVEMRYQLASSAAWRNLDVASKLGSYDP